MEIENIRIISGHRMCHPETCSCWNYTAEYEECIDWDEYSVPSEWHGLGIFADTISEITKKIKSKYPNATIDY